MFQNRTAVTSSVTVTGDAKEPLQSSKRLPDPRVTAIKAAAAAVATAVSSESDDTDMSNGGGTSSHAGDTSPGSQSPPALERVERLADKELSEDGVLIPPRPLAQWGVSVMISLQQQQQQLPALTVSVFTGLCNTTTTDFPTMFSQSYSFYLQYCTVLDSVIIVCSADQYYLDLPCWRLLIPTRL